jgi:hypothetical protein
VRAHRLAGTGLAAVALRVRVGDGVAGGVDGGLRVGLGLRGGGRERRELLAAVALLEDPLLAAAGRPADLPGRADQDAAVTGGRDPAEGRPDRFERLDDPGVGKEPAGDRLGGGRRAKEVEKGPRVGGGRSGSRGGAVRHLAQ